MDCSGKLCAQNIIKANKLSTHDEIMEETKTKRPYKRLLHGETKQDRIRSYGKQYAKDGRYKKWRLKSQYGLSIDSFDSMIIGQGNKCAACGRDFGTRGPIIDHDHKSGKVRGIVCHGCNVALGFFRDDKEVVLKLAEYLDRQ